VRLVWELAERVGHSLFSVTPCKISCLRGATTRSVVDLCSGSKVFAERSRACAALHIAPMERFIPLNVEPS